MSIKTIRGYISSDGSVKDYVLDVIGYDGYLDLCAQSVNTLNQMLRESFDSDEQQALIELRESYQKTINGEHNRSEPYLDPSAFYLKHCKILKVNTLRQPDNKPRKYRNNVTRIKAEVRTKLPISSYIGLIKLEPGKYDSISEGAEW